MSNLQNFTLTAGEDRTLTMTARSATGAILNLTGATISWRLVPAKSYRISLTKTGSIVSASAGTFSVTLDDTDTTSLDDGHFTYDALVTISGTTTNAARGEVLVSGSRIINATL